MCIRDSNVPKTQSEDPNTLPHAYAPNWETSHLVLTPVIFLDQTNVALDASGLTISWKRKDGTGAESALSSGETVSGGILTVSQNKLSASSSGMITYICYISYYDSETKNTVNISSDITYTLVKNAENAKLAYVTADTYVFKYNTSSALVGATQATLSAPVSYTHLERRCAEENGPVYVTKNGYGRLVVMDIEYYERTMQKMYEAKTIMEGLEDVKAGRTVDGEKAISDIRRKYGI